MVHLQIRIDVQIRINLANSHIDFFCRKLDDIILSVEDVNRQLWPIPFLFNWRNLTTF